MSCGTGRKRGKKNVAGHLLELDHTQGEIVGMTVISIFDVHRALHRNIFL
jgi:hypothetical protein